jgi:CBS domain-containing protein
MSEFPFQRVLSFVAGVVPFDTLSSEELEEVVSRMQVAFFPRGEVILRRGGPPADHLYLIQSGSAKVTLPAEDDEGEEILVDVRGEGDTFGAVSLLEGQQALFSVVAQEDLICLLLPAEVFRRLVETRPAFERHFRHSLARNLEAVRRGAAEECRLPQVTGVPAFSLDAALMTATVAQVMTTRVLTCLPPTPVRAAARRMTMRQVGSVVVVDEGGHPIGILTDTDLRVRVISQGGMLDAPVTEFMSRPLVTIPPQVRVWEALLTMSRHGVGHLVVTEQGRLVGIVSDHDLQTLTGASPLGVIRDIETVTSVDALVEVHAKVDRVLEMLLRQGGSARTMLELVTEFNDRLTLKLIELTEEEMEAQGKGRPPVPYAWLALGSEGRREQTLRTDQDNAIVFANLPAEHMPSVRAWFQDFAARVVEGLVRCGFPRCQGGVMASNPDWCRSEASWCRTISRWVADPQPQSLRLATIFFDFRPIYAEADFAEALDQHLMKELEGNKLFLRLLAKNGLYNRPPLGFLRQFVVLKDGEHKNKLNLKLSGLTPMVDAVRVMALDQQVAPSEVRARLQEELPFARVTNTLDRLEEIARRGLIKPAEAADLREAFSFITLMRIGHHLEARARGEVPDNFVDPAQLNGLQRKMLKESFGVIARLQDLLEHRYQTWLLT